MLYVDQSFSVYTSCMHSVFRIDHHLKGIILNQTLKAYSITPTKVLMSFSDNGLPWWLQILELKHGDDR